MASSLEIGGIAFSNYVVSAFPSAKDSDIDGLIGVNAFWSPLTFRMPNSCWSLFASGAASGSESEDAPPRRLAFFAPFEWAHTS